MKWDYVVKGRSVNDRLSTAKKEALLTISKNFQFINWTKESDHLFYFFKDTYLKGYISDIYPAPGMKNIKRLLSIQALKCQK